MLIPARLNYTIITVNCCRTYVIMGSGNLGDELKRLGELLVNIGLTAGQTMQLHLKVLEELLRGLALAAPATS